MIGVRGRSECFFRVILRGAIESGRRRELEIGTTVHISTQPLVSFHSRHFKSRVRQSPRVQEKPTSGGSGCSSDDRWQGDGKPAEERYRFQVQQCRQKPRSLVTGTGANKLGSLPSVRIFAAGWSTLVASRPSVRQRIRYAIFYSRDRWLAFPLVTRTMQQIWFAST